MTGNPSVSRYPIAPPDTPPLCVNSNFKRLHHTAPAAKYCLPARAIFPKAFNYQLIIMMRRKGIMTMKIMMKGEYDEYDIQVSPYLCGSYLKPSQAAMQCL